MDFLFEWNRRISLDFVGHIQTETIISPLYDIYHETNYIVQSQWIMTYQIKSNKTNIILSKINDMYISCIKTNINTNILYFSGSNNKKSCIIVLQFFFFLLTEYPGSTEVVQTRDRSEHGRCQGVTMWLTV